MKRLQQLGNVGLALILAACAPMSDAADHRIMAVQPVDLEETQWLAEAMEQVRLESGVPAIGAVVLLPDGKIAEAVSGTTKSEGGVPVRVDQNWHFGSLGKSMTAMVFARLDEKGILSLDQTMADIFVDESANWSDAARAITIEQLLTQNSGLRDDNLDEARLIGWTRLPGDMQARRQAMAMQILEEGPAASPDEGFAYANVNYIVVGAIAERIVGRPWEDIARDEFIIPLGLRTATFGAPGAADPSSAIWGHEYSDAGMRPIDPSTFEADNPREIAAAGTMNMTLRDWSRYARDQLVGERGEGALFSEAYYERAHQPHPFMPGYAYGWGVREGENGEHILSHTGSNNIWYAAARLFPDRNRAFLVVVNVADEPAEAALRAGLGLLQERYIPSAEE